MTAPLGAAPQGPTTLPHFTWDEHYERLRVSLWPAGGGPVEGNSARGEPPALLAIMEALTPDDGWLTPSIENSGSDDMDVDGSDSESEGDDPNDGEGVDEGPTEICYINLAAHPILAINILGRQLDKHPTKATFAVRNEYQVFMDYALSRVINPDDSYQARFFVTGKSFGCHYFLFRLLAMGQPVFFAISPTTVYYFSGDGVQKSMGELQQSDETIDAFRGSWVLIDIDEKNAYSPPPIFDRARFGAEPWYMKAWSTKEIAAVAERLALDRTTLKDRLDAGGPVAQTLWGGLPIPSPTTTDATITKALTPNIFTFILTGAGGQGGQPVHRVFLIQPLVVIDKETGRPYLQRTDYSAEFLSPYVAYRLSELAKDHLENLQEHLACALNMPATRSVAGKLFEGIMYRALTRGKPLPVVFGPGSVAGTLKLIGKAQNFVCETKTTNMAKVRPLYLRPESFNFTAVDAILVTHQKLGLIQASLGYSHRRDFGMMLRIMSRLRGGAQVNVSPLKEVIYCIVGTVPEQVQTLVDEASKTLAVLQTFDSQKLSEELGMQHTKIAHKRFSTFRVVGYTFDYKRGFTELQ
ncbi:hypothetical protein MVEN_01761300 [Mycena venus]|uniref:Uncharacterized protein n=1 Tax=Mycena venus TaxID=2733690 RepID=A0A8H6XLL8_9AGAR|nr:hypothetical protein MVEN_01761300 [Mycena venus]